jgi:nicotinamidase-related amidase
VHRFLQRFFECVGKLWPWVKDIAEEVNLLNNLRTIVGTAREAGIKIYHVPHHHWGSGDYVNRKYPSPYQLGAAAFAKDTWGGTFHDDLQAQPGDIVATEHWASSGFPNTDLEHKLKRYGRKRSSASACWRIPALKPRHASEWSSASMSRCSRRDSSPLT